MTETRGFAQSHPFQAMPPARAGRVFLAFLVLTIVLMAALQWADGPLETGAAPRGILSYEFAGTVERAQAIVDSWQGAPGPFAGFSLGLDYLYMVAYAVTIALGCLWASRKMAAARWPLVALGVALAWLLGAAAACDALENVALVVQLLVRVAPPWPVVAFVCATVKFALIIAGLLYAATGVPAWLVDRGKPAALAAG
jgi:hypothetical protein